MNEILAAGPLEWLTAAASAFGVIFLAEIGDKSQLVCMTLAARHHHSPVMLGSIAAFIVLNTLAVVFGVGLALWVPEKVVAGAVAILFGVFGIKSLLAKEEDGDEEVQELSGHSIFITTFLMLFLAEMGDKTQLAVAGMASTMPVLPVWVGSTLALATTSALGILVGRKLLSRIPLHRLHQISGVFFLILAAFALTKVF